ncbi:MAG: phosphatidylglycerophosphatase A [Ulvibacter sp.]|jgi:phosphatidylglycerophosphatase A
MPASLDSANSESEEDNLENKLRTRFQELYSIEIESKLTAIVNDIISFYAKAKDQSSAQINIILGSFSTSDMSEIFDDIKSEYEAMVNHRFYDLTKPEEVQSVIAYSSLLGIMIDDRDFGLVAILRQREAERGRANHSPSTSVEPEEEPSQKNPPSPLVSEPEMEEVLLKRSRSQ